MFLCLMFNDLSPDDMPMQSIQRTPHRQTHHNSLTSYHVHTNGLLLQMDCSYKWITYKWITYVRTNALTLLHINYRSLRHHRRAPSMMAECSFLPPLSVVDARMLLAMNAHAFNQTATKRFCQGVSGGGIVWFLGRPETLLAIRNDEHVELLQDHHHCCCSIVSPMRVSPNDSCRPESRRCSCLSWVPLIWCKFRCPVVSHGSFW